MKRFLYKTRWLLIGSILSWLFLMTTDMLDLSWEVNKSNFDVPIALKGLFLNAFFLLSFFTIKSINDKSSDSDDFYGVIWHAFSVSVTCAGFSMMIRLFLMAVGADFISRHYYLYNFFYHVDFALLVIFLETAFIKWKKLIRYQASPTLEKYWVYFEYVIFGVLMLNFIQFQYDIIFNTLLFLIGGFSLVVSFNLRWIPYLEFKQKLSSIFVFSVILVIQFYFFAEILAYSKIEMVILDTVKSVFFSVIYFFTAFYSVVSLLVLVFSLPTSSVFQKKMSEISRFHDLNGSLVGGKNEKQVYETLLDYAFQTSKSDAAWLELDNDSSDFVNKNISKTDALVIRNGIMQCGYDNENPKKYNKSNLPEDLLDSPFESFLTIPLCSNHIYLGRIVLMKRQANTFDSMTVNTLNAFAMQGSLVIYNFRLIADAMETQRYREEVKIAKRMHDKLLPKISISNAAFDFFVETDSADDVGGDYYDYFKISDTKYILIIADVSGKGTTAAFNMAQMKGIFHSLVRFDLSPDLFFEYANNALSSCLGKNMFITASYFVIDTDGKKLYFSRAGHCPSLYYSEKDKKTLVFKGKGLGLGIMRTPEYKKYIEIERYDFSKGDVLMLYTDGISEARNPNNGEEFGQDRIEKVLSEFPYAPLKEISEKVLVQLRDFTNHVDLKDDYTLAIVRFN